MSLLFILLAVLVYFLFSMITPFLKDAMQVEHSIVVLNKKLGAFLNGPPERPRKCEKFYDSIVCFD